MPQNGYIVAYLSNQSGQEAWFDNMNVGISNGMLLDEQHYYAYGLPIAGLRSIASNATPHRQRYQGNEYIEERGLEWMDFHNRQYDPQLGRFLSIDPLADAGGQQVLSPYQAMGFNPVSMVDPFGLQAFGPANPIVIQDPGAMIRAIAPTLLNHMPGGSLWGLSNMSRYISSMPKELRAEAWMLYLSGGNSTSFSHAYERFLFQRDMRNLRNEREYGSTELEGLVVIGNKPQWREWGGRMAERFGTSLGYSFGEYGQSDGFWDNVGKGFSLFWNSPIARRYVPDKLSFSIGGDIAFGLGIGTQPLNFTILTRGKEPGLYLTPTFNATVGLTAKVEGSINFSAGYYTGDPRDITSSMLSGTTHAAALSVKALAGVSIGASWTPADNTGNRFINVNAGLGVDAGFSLEYQYQYTPGVMPLWQW